MADDIVARARAALEGVTRGPWKLGNRHYPDVVHTPRGCLWHPDLGRINDPTDGEFIAAARTLVPELLAEVERLRGALGEAWDDGNGCGLDGWIGPGRGAGEIDDEAIHARDRCIDKLLRGDQ